MIDQHLDKTRTLLLYRSQTEAMINLVKGGLTPEDAYLVIKAATVVPEPPPFICPCCRNRNGRHKMSCHFVK